MSPHTALVVFALLIMGLFWLDSDKQIRTSIALWIPTIWLAIASSRSVSQWLQQGSIGTVEQVMEGSPLDRNAYTGLIVLGLLILLSRYRKVAVLLKNNATVVLFFVYCALSLAWSDFPDVAFKRLTKAIGDFVMVLIVLSDPDPLGSVKRLLARVTFFLIPLSVMFVKYFPELGKGYGRWDYKAFYTGVTTNKNTLGVICLLFGLASVWRIVAIYRDRNEVGRFRKLVAHVVILLMVFWLFSIANSMTSLSCFLMTLPLLLVANSRIVYRKPAFLHLLVVGIVALSVSALFFTTSLLQTIGRDPSLTDRTGIWDVVLSVSGNPVFGVGFESFWLGPRLAAIWRHFPWQPYEAHNGYLEIFLNLGWLGAILLALVIIKGYRTVFRAYCKKQPTGSLMLSYFVVGMVYNFTEAAFFRMMAPAWIILLLAITQTSQSDQSPAPEFKEEDVPQLKCAVSL